MTPISDWTDVLVELQKKLSPAVVKTWFYKTELVKTDERTFSLIFPNIFALERVNSHYRETVREALSRLLMVESLNLNLAVKKLITKPLGPLFSVTEELFKPPRPSLKTLAFGLSPFYTFEEFVVGGSNQLAFTVAQSVAQNPGAAYNPFFLHAATGLGKTHLMQAIGNEVINRHPQAKVVYSSGESFTNELLESIRGRTQKNFRQKFRNTDVLLIDDVQFIAGKEATQEEFFHAFNELYLAQKQIVLTSDRPPREITLLEDRLRSRFAGGMMADIQSPDENVRAAILRNKRDKGGFNVSNEILDFIASEVKNNIREMEGVFLQIIATAKTRGVEVGPELTHEILSQNKLLTQKQKPAPKKVLEEVCALFNLSRKDLTGPRRKKELVGPRQICMYLLRSLCLLPLVAVGQILGGRDHTTIMHGVERIAARLEEEEDLKQKINYLIVRICG